MKLTLKLILAFTVLTLSISLIKNDNQIFNIDSFYQQKQVFPNQYEAATNKTQLEFANYTSPFMSHVLFEEDPKRKLRMNEFISSLRFQAFRLTKGESEQIFNFADGNRDDLLDQGEWDTFAGLYILPFEACDRNHDYLLDEAEFADCFDRDPRSKFIIFRRRDQMDRHKKIMWTVTSRNKPLLNFHDYLFIRRALFSWKNCHSNSKFIAKGAFKCAMRVAIFSKMQFKLELESIYDTGVLMANEANIIELDFLNYLRTLYATYVFVVFGESASLPYIEKTSFLKGIREDRLPTNFEEREVGVLYDLINTNPLIPVTQMSFGSFFFFFNLHRLFNKYSSEKPLLLTKYEFMRLLDDKLTPGRSVVAVDISRTAFNETVYQEASLIMKRKRPNEGKYFYQFKQDASANTVAMWNDTAINATYYNVTKNETNREVFFTTFADVNKDNWSKDNYYRAFQLANLYCSMIPDNRHIISATTFVDNLMEQYSKVTPPVGWNQRKSYTLYKQIPREAYIDILLFSAIENFKTKFETFLKSSNSMIYESYAKMILQDFGMAHMPDPVLDLAKRGYDNLRRRTYDPNELMKNCIIVQAVAAENVRSKEMVMQFKIKTNLDNSRRFPGWPRRAQATPWV